MYQEIIDKYYPAGKLRDILLIHSRKVADKALAALDKHPELNLDRNFVEEAAMLHDIGIFLCDAQGIECQGTEPYICHGRLGAEILRNEGFPRHARVAERHTGTGLTIETIKNQNLPLPLEDFSPETKEEKLICWADKFFSKSHLEKEKTPEQVAKMLSRFPDADLSRFFTWNEMFN